MPERIERHTLAAAARVAKFTIKPPRHPVCTIKVANSCKLSDAPHGGTASSQNYCQQPCKAVRVAGCVSQIASSGPSSRRAEHAADKHVARAGKEFSYKLQAACTTSTASLLSAVVCRATHCSIALDLVAVELTAPI